MSYHKCNYMNCTNYKDKRPKRVRFYSFPGKDEARLKKWIEACGNPKLSKIPPQQLILMAVCELHFTERSFVNETHHRLIHSAVPIHYSTTMTPAEHPIEDIVADQSSVSNVVKVEEIKIEAAAESDPLALDAAVQSSKSTESPPHTVGITHPIVRRIAPFPCPLCCMETFSTLLELRKHLSRVIKHLACPACHRGFCKVVDLIAHLKECSTGLEIVRLDSTNVAKTEQDDDDDFLI